MIGLKKPVREQPAFLLLPHPSQLGFAKSQTPRCATREAGRLAHSPFLALRAEGGRELSAMEGRGAECAARVLALRTGKTVPPGNSCLMANAKFRK
jgi:hypothetical protein